MQTDDWIMSEGGPLLIVNANAASKWGGVLARKSAENRFANDYDKACQTNSYISSIRVNNSFALLLGDAPLDTCVWCNNYNKLYIVRVWYCDAEFNVDATMKQYPNALFEHANEVLLYTACSADFMMFDAAEPGDDPDKKVVNFRLPTGRYRILTQTYEPDARTSLVLHRFDQLGP